MKPKKQPTAVLLPLLNGGWPTPERKTEAHVRSYSITADILSFRRCRRQYGFFAVRGFNSATSTQRYFGTLVHDVLDQISRDWQKAKDDPGRALPDEAVVRELVRKAHNRLIRSGVRTYGAERQQEHATKLLDRFIRLTGAKFFDNIHKTEYRLERAIDAETPNPFVLEGVVDILSGAISHELKLPYRTRREDFEVWDYKSGRKDDQALRDYEYQMRVYAELYKQQKGQHPARAVLVFLGELADDKPWKNAEGRADRLPNLFHEVPFDKDSIDEAMSDFRATVHAIEEEGLKCYADQWPAPPKDDRPDDATCDACEIRYNCPSYPRANRQRKEPL